MDAAYISSSDRSRVQHYQHILLRQYFSSTRKHRRRKNNNNGANRLLQLLLGAELVGVTALLLTAVDRTGRETGIAHTADVLVAVELTGQHLKGRLDDTTSQTEHQVQGGLLLDVVVAQSTPILELLTCLGF